MSKARTRFEAEVLPELLKALRKQREALEAAVEVLQEAQALVPLPTARGVAEMRRGERPLSQEAFLLGAYQRLILASENLIADLRAASDKAALQKVHSLKLSAIDFNAIEAAVEELAARQRKA